MSSTVPSPRPPFAAAVLAGGRSSRMGSDKAFVLWRGRRLIDRQLALLKALGPTELLVSGRAGIDYGVADVRVVLDAQPDQGPLGGLAALLHATAAPNVLILAVDLPAMTEAFLERLLLQCCAGVGVVPLTESGWEPLVAVYPRDVLPVINARLARGDLAMHAMIAEATRAGLLQAVEITGLHRDVFRNLNTPLDLNAGADIESASSRLRRC